MTLTAQNLHATLGRTQVLNGIDLCAQAGEVTVIVGPNGSGKTTLLRALTGDLAFQGRVELNGTDTATVAAQDMARVRAVLPQASEVAFPFTVLEIVRLGLTAGQASDTPDFSDRLPLAALARVGLSGFEGRLFQELSGGEKQRVQLARVLTQIWQPVLHGTPRWLFLDEPVSALDIGHQLLVMQIAQAFARAGGGVLAVLHDLNLTTMIADQVILMNAGKVLAQGGAKAVFTNANLSAAYGCQIQMNTAPAGDIPWLLPQSASLPITAAAE